MSFVSIIAAMALAGSADGALSAEAAARDLALAKEALERIHPGYDRYADKADLDRAWRRLEREAEDGADATELYLGLSGLLADIRCDHTKAELSPDMAEAREADPVYLPFHFKIFDNRMFVEAADPATGLRRGDQILRIDGDRTARRLNAARPFMAVDGFTDHVRDLSLERTSEYYGSGFLHFDAMLEPDDSKVVLRVKTPGERARTVELDRIGYADWRAIKQEKRWTNFSDPGSVTLEMVSEDVAILSVETFVNYRTPVSPSKIYGPLFAKLKDESVGTLIVDVRRNGGGSTDAMAGLIARLTREDDNRVLTNVWVKTYDFDGLREHIRTWDPRALDPDPALFTERADGTFDVAPVANDQLLPFDQADDAFEGDIIILTSGRNASGVTQMYSVLAGQDGITLVGEETGGSQEGVTAGLLWFLELPESELVVRIPWFFQRTGVKDPVPGKGFIPDVIAPTTYHSWLNNEDAALEAALDLI
ncbi:MAG: hypothetical protein HRU11_12505, partial [Parvularculaceae bacterium]|nr:hypothetical protein [Parvularculaceae bacterium]